MARSSVLSRNAVAYRDNPSPQFYKATIHGDSLSDGTTGVIGDYLDLFTNRGIRLRRNATGGDALSAIRADFEVAGVFPKQYENMVILQGGINNIANIAIATDLATMKADMSAMVDAVIADGNNHLAIVNITPWGGHANWTQARQDQTDQYNQWLADTYPEYTVNAYAALSDPAAPTQMHDAYVKASRGDLHPNKNGDVKIDEMIGELLNAGNVNSIAEDAGNHVPNPKDFSAWTKTNCSMGGASTKLADGSNSSINGIINDGTASSGVLQQSFAAGLVPNATASKLEILFRPGLYNWARVNYLDNAGQGYGIYVDFLNLALGTSFGTGTKTNTTIEKFLNGWAKLTIEFTSGTGSSTNNINIQPASADATPVTTPIYANSPSIYVDLVQIVDA